MWFLYFDLFWFYRPNNFLVWDPVDVAFPSRSQPTNIWFAIFLLVYNDSLVYDSVKDIYELESAAASLSAASLPTIPTRDLLIWPESRFPLISRQKDFFISSNNSRCSKQYSSSYSTRSPWSCNYPHFFEPLNLQLGWDYTAWPKRNFDSCCSILLEPW